MKRSQVYDSRAICCLEAEHTMNSVLLLHRGTQETAWSIVHLTGVVAMDSGRLSSCEFIFRQCNFPLEFLQETILAFWLEVSEDPQDLEGL